MGLREDVRYIVGKDYEPKIPEKQIILKQAKEQLSKGKSTGSIKLDVKAIRSSKEDNER